MKKRLTKFRARENGLFGGDFIVDLLANSTFSNNFVKSFQNYDYSPLIVKATSATLDGTLST